MLRGAARDLSALSAAIREKDFENFIRRPRIDPYTPYCRNFFTIRAARPRPGRIAEKAHKAAIFAEYNLPTLPFAQ